jgi:elongation factor P--beta-lysine ligase
MLEYYRLGFDIHQLMDDMTDLLKSLGFTSPAVQLSYAQAFSEFANGKSGKYLHCPVPVVSSFLIQAKCANILL